MIYLDKSSVFRFWSWKANPGQGMAVSSYRDPCRWVTGWNMNILFNTIYRQFISMLVYTWQKVTLAKSLDTLLQILNWNTQSKDIVFMSIHLRYTCILLWLTQNMKWLLKDYKIYYSKFLIEIPKVIKTLSAHLHKCPQTDRVPGSRHGGANDWQMQKHTGC